MGEQSKSKEAAKKKPYVVKLDQGDRDRLQYICEQTNMTGAVLIRLLINKVSEGGFKAGGVSFDFDPYTPGDPTTES